MTELSGSPFIRITAAETLILWSSDGRCCDPLMVQKFAQAIREKKKLDMQYTWNCTKQLLQYLVKTVSKFTNNTFELLLMISTQKLGFTQGRKLYREYPASLTVLPTQFFVVCPI